MTLYTISFYYHIPSYPSSLKMHCCISGSFSPGQFALPPRTCYLPSPSSRLKCSAVDVYVINIRHDFKSLLYARSTVHDAMFSTGFYNINITFIVFSSSIYIRLKRGTFIHFIIIFNIYAYHLPYSLCESAKKAAQYFSPMCLSNKPSSLIARFVSLKNVQPPIIHIDMIIKIEVILRSHYSHTLTST
jgi:hypothetical protein